jgi:hypothetical protein
MFELAHYPLWLILPATIALMAMAIEFGRRYGMRNAARGGGGLGALEGAVLGLMTLMISFTFAMALTRFENRREALLFEANAIGTTGLRARLLPAPLDAEAIKLLRAYVQLRLDAIEKPDSPRRLAVLAAASGELQEKLWRVAKAAAERRPDMVPTGLFTNSLNEMIDSNERRLFTLRDSVPNIVLLALYGISFVGLAFAAYADGVEGRRVRTPVHVMGVMVTVALLLIQDLDRPDAGFLRIDMQPMLDTSAALASFRD